MHTMHTRAEAAPERWNQAETERKDVCIPGCIRMHTGRPECIHGPAPIGRIPRRTTEDLLEELVLYWFAESCVDQLDIVGIEFACRALHVFE